MCGPHRCCCLFGLLLVFVMSPPRALGLPGFSAHLPLPGRLPHVEQYEVVYPVRLLNARTRRDLSSPPTLYPENLRYVVAVKGRNFTLHLRRNLMGASYTETHTLANGTEVTEQPGDLQDHCFYQGHVEGHENSAVSVSACHGIRGFFQTGSTVHLIEPLEGKGSHAVYRAEHLIQKQKFVTCGVSSTTLEENLEPKMAAAQKPRNWRSGTILKQTRYVELFVLVDYAEYMKFNNLADIRSRVKEIVNHVDKLYQKFNFRVVLIGLEIWHRRDKTQISSNPEFTLDSFLRWRNQELVHRKEHDNAQLITAVDFESEMMGLAKVASMCTSNSGAVNQDHNNNPIGVASTIAHELGYNLGMDHDNIPGCYCHVHKENGGCIMAASLSGTVFPQAFSICSRRNLENFLENNIFQKSCLTNVPKLDEIYGGPQCGNRFVELGEECDCGTPEECTNHCCDATTCSLITGTTCAHGECCDKCQVMPAGKICREAQDVCDLPEYCDGQRGVCPENVFQENGTPCQDGYCYNGKCPTYQQQCQALWGQGASMAPDRCYLLNVRAICSASQGSDFNKCGFLHCSGVTSSHRAYCTITQNGRECTLATKDQDGEAFEMVMTGTKCGEHMVCYNRRCQDLHVYGSGNCSAQCSGHGVCNHKRECHCDPGWDPPYCQQKVADMIPEAKGVLVEVLVTVVVLVILISMVFVLYKHQMLSPFQKRKIATNPTSGLLNPSFQEGGYRVSGPISIVSAVQHPKPQSVLVVPRQPPPVLPAAARPQAPFSVPVYTRQAPQQSKPVPPSKPLPELKSKQVVKPTSAPPPPPIKPPAGTALKPQGAGPKVTPKPPAQRR